MVGKLLRKRWVAALGVVAALAIAGAAVAYFTAQGSGTGSATVGSVTSGLVIHGDVASGSYLFPGGDPVTVPITVTNNGAAAAHVGTVTLTKVATDSNHTGCDVTAFTMDPVTVNQTVGTGATSTEVDGSLKMSDTDANQDACKGASLTLTFASSAGS